MRNRSAEFCCNSQRQQALGMSNSSSQMGRRASMKFCGAFALFITLLGQQLMLLSAARQRPSREPASAAGGLFISPTTNLQPTNRTSSQKAPASSQISSVQRVQSPAQLAPISAPNRTGANPQTSLASVSSRWRLMEQSVSDQLRLDTDSLRRLLGKLIPEATNSTGNRSAVSARCKLALDELLGALDDSQLWAVQMLDASAHSTLPSGLLEGTLTELGNFDECLSIGGRSDDGQAPIGQYCTLLVKPALIQRPRLHTVCRRLPNLSTMQQLNSTRNFIKQIAQNSQHFFYAGLRLGVCTPSACTRADLQLLLAAYLAKYELTGQVKSCQTRLQSAWISQQESALLDAAQMDLSVALFGLRLDLVQQCIVFVLALLLLLNLAGTLMDRGDRRQHDADADLRARFGGRLRCACCGRIKAPHTCWQHKSPSRCHGMTMLPGVDTHSCALERLPSPSQFLGLQHNPLANFSVASTSDYEAFNMSIEINPTASSGSNSPAATTTLRNVARTIERKQSSGTQPADKETTAGRRPHLLRQLIECFSLKKNLRSISRLTDKPSGSCENSSTTNNNDGIEVIHGLRTLTMLWIIFGHTIGLVGPEMMNNLFSLAQVSCTSRLLQALLNATLAVDTFFMISGLVTVISFVRKCSSGREMLLGATRHKAAKDGDNAASNDDDLFASSSSIANSVLLGSSSLGAASNRSAGRRKNSSASSTSSSDKTSKGLLASDTQWRPSAGWPRDFQPFAWILLRYLRLTPSYATLIGLSIVLPALGAPGGPFWAETMGQLEPACRRNWWANLLYLNNFYETDKLCLIHSWYLSNDWQFFIIALILFGLMYKSLKLAMLLLVTAFLASSATTFAIIVSNEFPPTIVTTSPAVAERWQFIYSLYYKPWPHLPAYLVGLFVGYLILVGQRCDARAQLSSGWHLVCWLLFGSLALALLNSVYPWNMGIQVEPLVAGLHGATFRTLWAACNGWLIYALVCAPASTKRPRKNWLALLLAWRGFQLTSRLTYCAYLVHPLIIYHHFGVLRERLDSSLYGQAFRFMGTTVLSYLSALALSLLVESPSIQLQRLFSEWASRKARASVKLPAETKKTSEFIKPDDRSTSGDAMSDGSSSGSKSAGQRAKQRKGRCSRHKQQQLTSKLSRAPSESSQTSANNSALDEEFQQKLAQAIGRGFKIRSRLVAANGDSGPKRRSPLHQAQQQRPSRRLAGSSKKLPSGTRAELVPIFADHANHRSNGDHCIPPPPPPPPPPPKTTTTTTKHVRRGESFSTFLSVQPE